MALGADHFAVVGEAADAQAAISTALSEQPDICVLDAELPGGAVKATAAIVGNLPRTAVVLLADRRTDGPMLDAVRAGAVGYLYKDMDPERLRFALRGVTQGEAALPRTLVKRLMVEFRARAKGRTALGLDVDLTPREWDVLDLISQGSSTADAAASLAISEVTVRRHLSSAVAKLGVPSREAAVEAVRAARGR
jgi:DNA-binding NarL/FixJ family response regulator